MMSRSLLLALVAGAILLAGCTGNNGGTPGSQTPPGSTLTADSAQAMLASALQSPPDRFHVAIQFWKGTDLVATSNATYLNDTKEAYLEVGGGLVGRLSPTGSLPFSSLTVYKGPNGIVASGPSTSLVLPPENASGQSSLLLNQARGSGLAPFLSGGSALAYLEGDQVKVQSVEPTTCAGQSAVRVTFNHTVQSQSNVAVADLLTTQPPRLCHLETTMPTRANAQADPTSGASVRADFLYDSQVPAIPAAAKDALGLLYEKSGATNTSHQVWTFKGAPVRSLSDVSIEVKQPSDSSSGPAGFSFPDYPTMTTAWSMTLDQSPKTQDGLTLAFADNDHDGKVSAGDTLTIDNANGDLPPIVLKDLKTGTYVVPGPGLALGLGVLALAALLARGRRA
ncbi:MAG: hypothetical protein QOE90_832 [Thermoplasmata archaeon]|jgi:hypothetical protein|nr:hypothetical protein [Thermoplasmata archaeon]